MFKGKHPTPAAKISIGKILADLKLKDQTSVQRTIKQIYAALNIGKIFE